MKWRQIFSRTNDSTDAQRNIRQPILSVENQRTNTYWGDELKEKDDDTLRVYSGNVNGFTLDRRGGTFDQYCTMLKEVQADIACGQEHNLDTVQSPIRSILYDTARQHWQRSRINFSNTPVAFKNQYKPGGTFIMTMGHASGRVRTTYQDQWGRWVSHKLQGREGRVITIISAYQVVTDSPGKGLTTSASQQRSLLIQAQDNITAPRAAFRRDLSSYLQQCRENNEEILLLGDFNECIGMDPDAMQKILDDNNLADIMKRKHGGPLPPTYARGHKCLDYAFATPNIINSVTKAGYEAFNAKYSTDHRAYYVDFNTDQLFGIQIQPLAKFEPRVLKSNNLKQVTAYIRAKHKHLEEHNIFERIRRLEIPGNRHQFAERIDKDVVAASLSAEKSIPRFDKPQWSVGLAQARKKVQVLEKWLSAKRTSIRNHEVITQTWCEIGLSLDELPTTTRQCTQMLREAKGEVKGIVQESYQRRDRERRNRIETLEASNGKADANEAKRLRCLQKGEALRNLFDKLRRLRLTAAKTGVTRLEIPVQQGDDILQGEVWQQIDIPSEILHHLRERNKRHFGQAHGTPFTVPPLSEELGFTGQQPAAEAILKGEYSNNDLDDNVSLLLQYLKQTERIAAMPISPTITEDEFRGKLQAWRETTTTSPSGLHLGHYKALFAKHSFSHIPEEEDEEHKRQREELDQMQAELADIHLRLINYALQRGYSYSRWHKVANTIIFKEPGNIRINRTRVIHLYEADYNLAMGLKWRSALYEAEKMNILNEGQYGSRPNRNAYDPVLIEELQLEMSRLTRKTLVQTNYDATACYDRIVPNLAMVSSRTFGVPATVTSTNASTLLQAKYHIRTELGLDEEGYSHCHTQPIYGTGQGSGNSPVIWCFLSSVLYDCYEKRAHKAVYYPPDKSEKVELGMVGFVDDSNGQTNTFVEEETEHTRQSVLHQLRRNAQIWSNLLSTTGGALELTKCSYHVMAWQFTGAGSPVLTTDVEKYSGASVRDSTTGEGKLLKYLSPYEAHKTLGHYKEPAGTQKEQYRQLKRKSDGSIEFMRNCSLTREEAWTFYYACYLPSIGYPLANCSYFTEAQLTNIQRKAMAVIYAKCGYNRNTKREILFGPLELGGANFRHLYDQQGIGQIQLFLFHWRSHTQAGRLLRCAVAWAQYCAGISTPILENVHVELVHLESRWLSSLRKYLSHIKAGIQVDKNGVVPLEREHDTYIMDHILASQQFTPSEIRKLNYCRMYLGALTIADLATTKGDRLDNAKLHGERSLFSIETKFIRVHQERPNMAVWKLWRKANSLWSQNDGTLRQPLGKWARGHRDSRLEHFAYATHDSMYVKITGGMFAYCRRENAYYYQQTTRTVQGIDLPISAIPVETEDEGSDRWKIIHKTAIIPTPRQPTIATFTDYVQSLEAWEVDLLEHTELIADAYTICLDLQDAFAAGSDGSEKYGNTGAFGWTLSNLEGERAATGMGPSRGHVMDSYRAECSGMLSILRFLIRLAEFTAMDGTWTGTIGTDSQSMLDTLFGRGNDNSPAAKEPTSLQPDVEPLNPLIPEWDLLVEIRNTLLQLPNVKLVYVKGHQDATRAYSRLDLLAQLNVDADDMARTFQERFGQPRPYAHMTTHTGAFLIYPEGTLTAKYAKDIRRRATSGPLKKYIQLKNNFDDSTMDMINWGAHGKAMRKHIKQRIQLTKMVHECLPTLKHVNRQDNGKRQCPGCHHCFTEDRDHIIRCRSDSREMWRQTFLASLEEFHAKMDTYRPLRQLLTSALTEWMQSEDDDMVLNPNEYHRDVHQVISQQNSIGWRQMINGRFGNEWSKTQDDYYARERRQRGKDDKRTGQRWQIQLITHIWKHWMKLWKLRNEELHGRDTATQNQALRRDVERELRAAYDKRQHYEPRVQELLSRNIQDQLQRPTWVLQNWLTVNKPIFRESMRRVKNTTLAGVRSIRSYFQPTRMDG